MVTKQNLQRAMLVLLLSGASGCSKAEQSNEGAAAATTAAAAAQATVAPAAWPADLRPFGDGYPNAGDSCRRVGETAATADFLDDSATLVGCPSEQAATALGGKVLATIGGITLVSVSNAQPAAKAGEGDSQPDAKVAGTAYNATADIPCAGPGTANGNCKAGVTRSAEQIAVDVTLPGGKSRTLLFDGKGKFVTHASAEADGSAALTSSGKREGEWTVVKVGREEYRVPDAFTLGG